MAAIEELKDAVTLKRDGRRISLEGVLTGAALGILLLYMLDEAAAASLGPRRGGPIDGPGDVDLGPFRTGVGKIDVAPLEEIDLGPIDTPNPLNTGNDDPKGGGGDGSAPPLPAGGRNVSERNFISDLDPLPISYGNSADRGFSAGGGTGANDRTGLLFIGGTAIRPPIPANPPLPPPPPPPPPPIARELPEVILVLVRTANSSASRSLEGQASSSQSINQHGVEYSRLNLQQAGGVNFEVLSERDLKGSGVSELDDASLEMIASNAVLVASQLLGGAIGDVYVLGARDFITLGLFTDAEAAASLQSSTSSMVASSINDGSGNNFVKLQANTQLKFTSLGDSQRARLAFDLLTQGMRDSLIALGGGDDRVSIVSGYSGGQGIIGINSSAAPAQIPETDTGLSFDLSDTASLLPDMKAWSFSLKTTAIGMRDSSVSTGGGNDEVTIYTQIDDLLSHDLGGLLNDPATLIEQQRIGLWHSNVDVGAGDDVVQINGAIIDSTINLGDGNNILVLEGSIDDGSRILSGNGDNQIAIYGNLGGSVVGGSGDDNFLLNALALAGSLDGGAGNDSLSCGTSDQRDLALIQGPNEGLLGGLRFTSIEGLDLGGGDDVALMGLAGTLSGQLLGGDGLDRLEFSNWELPVSVDLDLGSATAIYGGAKGGLRGFEQVFGGMGNDVLAASGRFRGLDGSEGDDVLFLRWTPWLSPSAQELELRGGGGKDLFVIAGLESAIPPEWDGVSGIPMLSDLRFDRMALDSEDSDRLRWLRQVMAPDGTITQDFIDLTPSGPEGIGNVKLLPIAPLEQLLSGMSDNTRQLAIALDSSKSNSLAELLLLDGQWPGGSRLIAYVPADVLIPELQTTRIS